jgi:regulator of sigma E protease
VKIFGENPAEVEESLIEKKVSDNFQSKNRGIQAVVLAAGVFCNFLFAWLLISIGLVSGLPAPAGLSLPLENPETVFTVVIPGSPAAEGGLRTGDVVSSLARGGEVIPAAGEELTPEVASTFITQSLAPITFTIERGDEVLEKIITPQEGIIPGRPAIGVSMEVVGTATLPIHKALYHGFLITVDLTIATAKALGSFLSQAVLGRADLSSVTGPVGLVGMVGEVKELGLGYLLSFTALISINLSIINLLPFPALDGGRLLFVGIEAVTRRTIPVRLFNALNAAGFALLVFLMILITIRDVRNIF